MGNPITLSVLELIQSPFAVAEDDADNLRHELARRLRAGQRVILDFTGIEMLTTSFVNPAIALLYGSDLPPKAIDTLLSFEGVFEEDMDRIAAAKERGEQLLAHPELFDNDHAAGSAY